MRIENLRLKSALGATCVRNYFRMVPHVLCMSRLCIFLTLVAVTQQCDVMFTFSSGDVPAHVEACAPQTVCATVAYGQRHNALHVSENQYNLCTAPETNQLVYSSGQTIQLAAPQAGETKHFICTLPGHCQNNAKFKLVCASTTPPPVSLAQKNSPALLSTALGLSASALLMAWNPRKPSQKRWKRVTVRTQQLTRWMKLAWIVLHADVTYCIFHYERRWWKHFWRPRKTR